jgi:hypothetical protein
VPAKERQTLGGVNDSGDQGSLKSVQGPKDFRPAEQPPMDFRQQTDATINASERTIVQVGRNTSSLSNEQTMGATACRLANRTDKQRQFCFARGMATPQTQFESVLRRLLDTDAMCKQFHIQIHRVT